MSEKNNEKKVASVSLIDEYKKIHWPSKLEVFHTTVIVLLVTLFVAFYVLAFDAAFNILLGSLTKFLKPLLGGI